MDEAHKKKITAAYLDTDLEDRPGEEWEDVPGFDGYFRISNFGRVKRIERDIYDSQGGWYILPAKIRLAQINHSPNRFTHDNTQRLQVTLQLQNKKYSFMVHRIVYYCFVEPFDLDDLDLNVVARDGNGLNIRPDNLLLATVHERCQRTYEAGRLPSPAEIDPDNIKKAVKASTAVTSKKVSRYDLQGKLIKTYISIQDAARRTHMSHNGIQRLANNPNMKPNRAYWRFGDAPFIEIEKARQKWLAHHKMAVGKKVTKYDLQGNPIGWYAALSEAAGESGVSHKTITNCTKGITRQAGGFQWKLGHHKKKLPPLDNLKSY